MLLLVLWVAVESQDERRSDGKVTVNGVSADGSWAGNRGCPGRGRDGGKKLKSADGVREAADGRRRAGCRHGVDMWRKLVFHLADVSGRTERYVP